MAGTHSHPFHINTWCELFTKGWDTQPVLPYQHCKWLGCTASITISTLQMAGMYSQYYHSNITNGWDVQPVLPYQPYKWLGCTASITMYTIQMAGIYSQYYHINITNDKNPQPVLWYQHYNWLRCISSITPWIPHDTWSSFFPTPGTQPF